MTIETSTQESSFTLLENGKLGSRPVFIIAPLQKRNIKHAGGVTNQFEHFIFIKTTDLVRSDITLHDLNSAIHDTKMIETFVRSASVYSTYRIIKQIY